MSTSMLKDPSNGKPRQKTSWKFGELQMGFSYPPRGKKTLLVAFRNSPGDGYHALAGTFDLNAIKKQMFWRLLKIVPLANLQAYTNWAFVSPELSNFIRNSKRPDPDGKRKNV